MRESVEQLFETLIRAVDQKAQELASQIAEAASRREFERVGSLSERWKTLKDLEFKLSRLSGQWRNLSSEDEDSITKPMNDDREWRLPNDFEFKVAGLSLESRGAVVESRGSTKKRHLRNGDKAKTPEVAFTIPILEALVELGGSGSVSAVLDLVYEKMKDVLLPGDLEPRKSDPDTQRWQNAAQWCRLRLVKMGLLKAGSPWGIWEISEKGRWYLEQYRNERKALS